MWTIHGPWFMGWIKPAQNLTQIILNCTNVEKHLVCIKYKTKQQKTIDSTSTICDNIRTLNLR